MDSRSVDKHAATQSIPVYIAPRMDASEELSLIDLWCVVNKRKGIILASLLLSVLLVFGYLFFAKPVYTAKSYLLPPPQQKIQELLINSHGIQGIEVNQFTPESVFDDFLVNLESHGMRREFFEDHELIKHYAPGELAKNNSVDRVFDKLFSERLKVQVDKQNDSFVMVSFSYSDPELAAKWLNEFIVFAHKRTVHQLFSDVNAAIQSEIDQIRNRLRIKLKSAEQRRRDTIVKLSEALSVAKTLKINDANAFPNMADKTRPQLAVNTAQVPLYMRGVEALKTEIAVLESRKSDEPFISDFRDLQERQSFLEGVSIDTDLLWATTIDAVAKTPYRAERARQLLLVFIAVTLGLIIGIFLALIAEFRSKKFDEHQNTTA